VIVLDKGAWKTLSTNGAERRSIHQKPGAEAGTCEMRLALVITCEFNISEHL
jgi:hypothetical protein